MAGKSDYLENLVLDTIFGNASWTPLTTIYLALYTTMPTDSGDGVSGSRLAITGDGVSGSRLAITNDTNSWNAASNGAKTNKAIFTATSGANATILGIGLYTATSSGHLLYFGTLGTVETPLTRAVQIGDTINIQAGTLTITED